MKASLIIPSHRSQETLPRTLESVKVAARGLDVETIVIEDAEGRGPSWARNRGLERAAGNAVFFCDADDTVRPDFFRAPLAALERTGADLCFFSYAGGPKLPARELRMNAEVREAYLPAFFGYSFDDVRRWNEGGNLMLKKELGSVCWRAFRRDFLERNRIRFDETMSFYEDAAFLSHCVALADRAVSIPDVLYDYLPRPDGNLASGSGSERHWRYKFLSLAFRGRLDALTGGAVWKYCEASVVFSALELLRKWRGKGLARYLADANVASAVRGFPTSWSRHPLTAAGVAALRIILWQMEHTSGAARAKRS